MFYVRINSRVSGKNGRTRRKVTNEESGTTEKENPRMIMESSVWKRPLSLYERGQTMEGKSKASFLERRAAHPNNKMIRTPVCLPSFSILLSIPLPTFVSSDWSQLVYKCRYYCNEPLLMAISPSACSIAQTSPRDRTLANSLNRPRNLSFPDRARRRKDIDATIPDFEFDSIQPSPVIWRKICPIFLLVQGCLGTNVVSTRMNLVNIFTALDAYVIDPKYLLRIN